MELETIGSILDICAIICAVFAAIIFMQITVTNAEIKKLNCDYNRERKKLIKLIEKNLKDEDKKDTTFKNKLEKIYKLLKDKTYL
jgi:hypothetical protein